MSSMGIAYNLKKKKMAEGGDVNSGGATSQASYPKPATPKPSDDSSKKTVGQIIGYPGMAEGGDVPDIDPKKAAEFAKGASESHPEDWSYLKNLKEGLGLFNGGAVAPQSGESMNKAAMREDDLNLNQTDKEDLVDRILRKHYSEGGKVANEDMPTADFMPNSFDDLALRDDLESDNTGASSGDFLGNEQEDHDREDIVSRVMKSRSKKDRMPRPA